MRTLQELLAFGRLVRAPAQDVQSAFIKLSYHIRNFFIGDPDRICLNLLQSMKLPDASTVYMFQFRNQHH